MRTFSVFCLVCVFFIVLEQFPGCTAFDCSKVEVEGKTFDLSSLNKEWNVSTEEEDQSSPAKKKIEYQINICKPLPYNESLGKDTCVEGTNICMITSYTRDDKSMIVDVKQIVNSSTDVQAKFSKSKEGATLEIILQGAEYKNQVQKANITLSLANDNTNDPTIKEYSNNTLFIKWQTNITWNDTGDTGDDKSWSLFSTFLFLIFIGFLGYLIIGVAYNHHTYNSHGWDLLPHRDFWRNVPNMLSDLSKNMLNYISGHYRGYSQV